MKRYIRFYLVLFVVLALVTGGMLSKSILIANADTTPPTVSLIAPLNNTTISGSVKVDVSVNDDVGVTKVEYYLGATLIAYDDTSPKFNENWDSTTVSDGQYTMTAKAYDAAGNSTISSPITITVNNGTGGGSDTTPPTVAITYPTSGSTVSGTITITADASDTVGVTNVEFYRGSKLLTTDAISPYSVTFDTTTLSDGSRSFSAKAYDAAGNSATSAVSVIISNQGSSDTTPPTVSITTPVNNATVSDTISVNANASDNSGTVAGVQFKLDDAALGAEDTSSPFSTSFDTTSAANGTHILTAVARDPSGNQTTSSAITVTVSNSGGGGTPWQPDHTVVVIMENKTAGEITASKAPYIVNTMRPMGRFLSNNYGIIISGTGVAHPSQPQYLELFSGSNQGVTGDTCSNSTSYTTPNLGAELNTVGKSWAWYSEDLPSKPACSSGNYVKRHDVAAYWVGNGANQFDASHNVNYTAFPTTPAGFSAMPKVSIIDPNICDDMHSRCNGVDTIVEGNKWLQDNMDSYIQWAQNNNSLFILTFDESDSKTGNKISDRIYTLMIGPAAHVVPNSTDSTTYNHFSELRFLEDAYGTATHAGGAATATKIVLP